MQNPYRVTPPLMSEGTSFNTAKEEAQTVQPTLSAPAGEAQKTPSQQKVTLDSHVEMDTLQKAPKEPAKAAQQSASKSKTKKSATAFRTISEVANELDVQQHVLRFWETKFTQVKPLKRGGGRRYYRPEDVALLKRIHHLLYTEGYTIKGVQKLLKGRGKTQIAAGEANNQNAAESVAPAPQPKIPAPAQSKGEAEQAGMSAKQRAVLEIMLAELKALRGMIKA